MAGGATGADAFAPSATATAQPVSNANEWPNNRNAAGTETSSLESGETAALIPRGDKFAADSSGRGGGEENDGDGGERGANAGRRQAAEAQVAVVNVEGMTCAVCVGIVENLLRRRVRMLEADGSGWLLR